MFGVVVFHERGSTSLTRQARRIGAVVADTHELLLVLKFCSNVVALRDDYMGEGFAECFLVDIL